jgi:type VI secretion system secreted protein VgrG
MPNYTQENRIIGIATPLGKDALLLKSFLMREELGRPFVCECELRSELSDIKYDDIVGHPVAIRINLPDGGERYINGVVSRFGHEGVVAAGLINSYSMTIVPAVWFLSRTATCRIFQQKSVPDIIKQVLSEYGEVDVTMELKATYAPCEYVVQYRETALDFISRLMEEEGMYYYFKHDRDKHTMVVVDDMTAHKPVTGGDSTISFREHQDFDGDSSFVMGVDRARTVMPGVVSLRAFDFQNPGRLLDSQRKTATQKHPLKSFEQYDYPGRYDAKSAGDRYAQVRLEQYDCQHERYRFVSSAKHVTTGYKFTLSDYPLDGLNVEYLVTGAEYAADSGEFGSKGQAPSGRSYQVALLGITSKTPYRSDPVTPKPRIAGPQTAFVVGPAGEEIFPDKFGRVKVQFLWDREGKSDDKSSCFIRVSQGWAGARFGMMFLPRVGQEVIVEFLEGDPDRPIITGRVYNGGEGQLPYALPANKTYSTIKTSSSTGGSGFNEIRFEDKAGSEHMFIHAQKDYHLRVKNDVHTNIEHDQHLIVDNDSSEHIKNDRSEIVKRDHKEKIGRDRNVKVMGKEAIEIVGSHSEKIKGEVVELYEDKMSTVVKNDLYIKAKNICIEAETNITLKVGSTYIAIEADSQKLEATGKIEVKTGADFASDVGAKFSVKAMSAAEIKVSAGDFKAEGLNAQVKGSVGAKLEGGVNADVKGAMASLEGSGMAKVKGGMVMIN